MRRSAVENADGAPTLRRMIGVVGGGQLARMMYEESIPLGIELRFLVEGPDDPVAQVSPHFSIGSGRSGDDLRRFAAEVDVLTFDHEVVDLPTLASLEVSGHTLRPSATAFATVAHKHRMREALIDAGLAVPPFRSTTDPAEAAQIVAEEGPQVLKIAHGGYDGRGTFFVDDPAVAARVVEGASGREVLMEPHLDLLAEMAVLVVRGTTGEKVAYEPVTTIQVDGQCRRVDTPAQHPQALLDSAVTMARDAAEALDTVGVLAVEMFLTYGGLLINELAARPHNSGHHTLDANRTSQFENHLRAVSGLALGDPAATTEYAVTGNVIGRDAATDPRNNLDVVLALDSGARVHLYGKSPRVDRKLGHVTVCDDDHDRAVDRVRQAVNAIGGQEVPR
jgi:5-(carboxyamino)imidazole ribonucleotide synthase